MQQLINRYFFIFFLFTYVFGLLFYNSIALLTGFEGTDELCLLVLLSAYVYIVFSGKDWRVNKAFLVTLAVFAFYLIYSFWIGSNAPRGIVMDFIIQLKPYLGFFCVYQLKPRMDERQRILVNEGCLLIWVVMLVPLGLLGAVDENYLKAIIQHPTNFAAAVTVTSLLYLFTSRYRTLDRIVFVLLLSIGLLSGRSKFFGFFVIASSVALYFSKPDRIRISFKNVALLLAVLAVTVAVAWQKLEFYFVQGVSDEADMDYIARFVLYGTALLVFLDFMPFGSGFASFATYASGVYYSPLYEKYGIDTVWGLSKAYSSFIADTYYPSLAQFGVVGVVLFAVFWLYLLRKSLSLKAAKHPKYFVMTLSIICYFIIENIADASFTSNRGLVVMMLLGYVLSDLYSQSTAKDITTEDETA